SKLSVNETAKIAINTPGRRDGSEKSAPRPWLPSAAPKICFKSLIDADKLVADQLTAHKSTTPIKIPTIDVAAIDKITPPRMPFTIKKIVIAKPIKARMTAGELKATKPGVAEASAVIEAKPLSAPVPDTV